MVSKDCFAAPQNNNENRITYNIYIFRYRALCTILKDRYFLMYENVNITVNENINITVNENIQKHLSNYF